MPPMRLLGRSIRTSTLRLVTIVGVTMAILVPGSAALAEPTPLKSRRKSTQLEYTRTDN